MAVIGVIYATDRLKFIRNNSRPGEPRPTDIIIIIEDAPIGKWRRWMLLMANSGEFLQRKLMGADTDNRAFGYQML